MFSATQLFTPPTTPISSTRGNQSPAELAEFAASMVYFMWHARKFTTAAAATNKEWSPSPSFINHDLAYLMWQSRKPSHSHHLDHPYSTTTTTNTTTTTTNNNNNTASPAFKKFCFQVLTATQLQESAVYLSLKYIAILLQSNPTIEGAEGSEYRLFIVALMLANKFLDDNTFTNKTWSEVSGMKVNDLNIMEAEFLEALDYNLFVREHEFGIWKQLLEECKDRIQLSSYYDSPQQLVLMTLQTLGLYKSNYWERLQLENSHKRYQHFLQQQQQQQYYYYQPYVMQPPVRYNTTCYDYPITNLSQSSWDPLAYSLNRCQDSSSTSFYTNTARPISWRNYN